MKRQREDTKQNSGVLPGSWLPCSFSPCLARLVSKLGFLKSMCFDLRLAELRHGTQGEGIRSHQNLELPTCVQHGCPGIKCVMSVLTSTEPVNMPLGMQCARQRCVHCLLQRP